MSHVSQTIRSILHPSDNSLFVVAIDPDASVRPNQRRGSRLPPDSGFVHAAGGARAAKRL